MKELYLRKRRLNAHLLLSGINTICKTTKLSPRLSITMLMKQQHMVFLGLLDDLKHYEIFRKYPECSREKEICYYVFETKKESYIQNGERKTYVRIARVYEKVAVNEIVKKLLSQSNIYLRHRCHVDNIAKVFPLIKETFNGSMVAI